MRRQWEKKALGNLKILLSTQPHFLTVFPWARNLDVRLQVCISRPTYSPCSPGRQPPGQRLKLSRQIAAESRSKAPFPGCHAFCFLESQKLFFIFSSKILSEIAKYNSDQKAPFCGDSGRGLAIFMVITAVCSRGPLEHQKRTLVSLKSF